MGGGGEVDQSITNAAWESYWYSKNYSRDDAQRKGYPSAAHLPIANQSPGMWLGGSGSDGQWQMRRLGKWTCWRESVAQTGSRGFLGLVGGDELSQLMGEDRHSGVMCAVDLTEYQE